MSEICIHCKEPGFDPEERVCTACGLVTEGITFGSEITGHSSYQHSSKTRKRSRTPLGLKFGMDKLDSLCDSYKVPSYMKDQASLLLTEIHSSQSFHIIQDVGIMAGCCLIHVLRGYNRHIPISDLCSKLMCAKKSISKCFKIIKKLNKHHHPLTVEAKNATSEEGDFNLEALKKTVLCAMEKIPDEDKAIMTEKTTELVRLAFSLWLGTGRSVEGLVVASAFLCWKSMHPSRKTLTLPRFCQEFSLNSNKARVKVSELNEMLLKLGEKIPSLTKNYVTEKNVLFHLDYILKNSTSLRNDINSEEFDVEEISKKEYAMFRKPPVKTAKHIKIETVTYDDTMCASDIEISDTEINSYIRSEEQVKVIKALRNLKKCEEEEQID